MNYVPDDSNSKEVSLAESNENLESSDEYQSAEEDGVETKVMINGSSSSEVSVSSYASAEHEKWRNLFAYWFLGLTNNFGYVIMLSAAHDILSKDFDDGNSTSSNVNEQGIFWTTTNSNNSSVVNPRDCNMMSTGTVLLADIIPSLAMKLMAPFIPFFIHIRIGFVVFLSALSYILVGSAPNSSTALLGVIFASASAGIGESSFLAYSSYYHQDVVSTWSSGTGGAGLFGALSYAALTSLGLTPRQSILFMIIVPVIMSVSFWKVLEHPLHLRCCRTSPRTLVYHQIEDDPAASLRAPMSQRLTFDEKLRVIPSLFKFMIPLTLVYAGEYLINQGLSELVYFPNEVGWITHEQQYRWYQVLYQIGVFISRSSVNLVYIQKIWITSFLQWLNVVIFLTAAIYWWFGTIWVAFALILWEGLLGGAAYVNTFYKLANEVNPEEKEFAIQMTSMSDTFGITVAGFIAIPLHNFICNLPIL